MASFNFPRGYREPAPEDVRPGPEEEGPAPFRDMRITVGDESVEGVVGGTISFRVGAPAPVSIVFDEAAQMLTYGGRCGCDECVGDREGMKPLERARRLLDSLLTKEQRRDLAVRCWFIVETPRGALYKLHKDVLVWRVDRTGRDLARFCINMYGYPTGDALAGIKLMLETNEERFLRTANFYGMAPRPAVNLEKIDVECDQPLRCPEHYEVLARRRPTFDDLGYRRVVMPDIQPRERRYRFRPDLPF